MLAFSQSISTLRGQPLGGYAELRRSRDDSTDLELNGFSFPVRDRSQIVEVCTVDALYAGELARVSSADTTRRIIAASHTHYAPMLDGDKPSLGAVAHESVAAWRAAIESTTRTPVDPTHCVVHRVELPVPIYRRFDTPDGALNRLLTAHAGMTPNEHQLIDTHLYLFEFANEQGAEFVIALHACHPVSRVRRDIVSPDYIGAIRRAVRVRFGSVPCLFFLGCCGDVRPNLARKRVWWLPRSQLNWRFEWPVRDSSERWVDEQYFKAALGAREWRRFPIAAEDFKMETRVVRLIHQGPVETVRLHVGTHLRFDFIPFEVSHRFHLDAQRADDMRFIVSCAGRTRGYLPHPTQLKAGGYEVDGSRACMGLADRVLLEPGEVL